MSSGTSMVVVTERSSLNSSSHRSDPTGEALGSTVAAASPSVVAGGTVPVVASAEELASSTGSVNDDLARELLGLRVVMHGDVRCVAEPCGHVGGATVRHEDRVGARHREGLLARVGAERVGLDDRVGRLALDLSRERHAIRLEETVRWAMPNPIITAAATNATMARAKRTNKPPVPHLAASNKDIPHYRRVSGSLLTVA